MNEPTKSKRETETEREGKRGRFHISSTCETVGASVNFMDLLCKYVHATSKQ